MKKALITGITGQDGSYLAEFLMKKGYEVHGIVRRASTFNRQRLKHLLEKDMISGWTGVETTNLMLHYGDLTDPSSIEKTIKEVQPNEVYNLAAQSQVRISFDIPENTSNVVALGTLRVLEAVKNFCPNARVYQASSSEMFGKASEIPQSEKTPFHPRSPYGCAKVHAHHITINYRESYGLYASTGILFNHESERRGEAFVTRKITRALTRIKLGLQKNVYLGNLDAERDWGHAKDYVEAMWLILQQDEPDDYVIGTGEKHTVREFLEEVAKFLGLNIKSNGAKGIHEQYSDENGNIIVMIHPKYFRPAEVDLLVADPTKAKTKLGWKPKIKFKDLVKIMTEHDLELAKKELYLDEKMENNFEPKENSEKKFKMEFSTAEINDKMSILRLKIERIGEPHLNKEYEECKNSLEIFKEKGVEIEQDWFGKLYEVNGKIWDLDFEIRDLADKEIEDIDKEESVRIGKNALIIMDLMKERIRIKNVITEKTGFGFIEIKTDHASA